MKKSEIPEWIKLNEPKAIIKANGQNIYFASLKDAKKVNAFATEYYRKHHRKIDFKPPRAIKSGLSEVVFVEVVEPKPEGDFSRLKQILSNTETPDEEKILCIEGWLREHDDNL